jgi:hypothetical protein
MKKGMQIPIQKPQKRQMRQKGKSTAVEEECACGAVAVFLVEELCGCFFAEGFGVGEVCY